MTGKERLFAAIKGEPVDRAPIWLREGFNVGGTDIIDEPLKFGTEKGRFVREWKNNSLYREIFDYVSPHIDVMRVWSVGAYVNRYLMIPPEYIESNERQIDDNRIRIEGFINTQKGKLNFVNEIMRGVDTVWKIEYPVKTVDDLKKIAEIPFHFEAENIQPCFDDYRKIHEELGDRGIMRIEFPSPIVAISGSMSFENFLVMAQTEKKLFHQLLKEITEREKVIIESIFKERELETIVNFGGAEQCTPPLMHPEAFDEFVVPYDGQLVEQLKAYGLLVNMHCHGKVKHALKCMREIGINSTDPVEPLPAGDVTYGEAREIAGDDVTIIGNLEFDELEHQSPEYIRSRIKEILSFGNRNLILGASAGPISKVTEALVNNYKAWIDAALECSNVGV